MHLAPIQFPPHLRGLMTQAAVADLLVRPSLRCPWRRRWLDQQPRATTTDEPRSCTVRSHLRPCVRSWSSGASGSRPSVRCIVEPTAVRPPVPEPGQVVEVRGSTWAVANVQAQGLPRSPADEATAGPHPRRRSAVARRGPARRAAERRVGAGGRPHRHPGAGSAGARSTQRRSTIPTTLAGFVDAMRWGAVTSADPNRYQAPFWSGVNVEAYQLEPLRRALGAPRTNLLLADDVGLGKTIEAGLVIQELLLRHRARTAVIVCPPSLSLKWQDEMRDKFGLEFTIVNSELMARGAPHARPARQPVPDVPAGDRDHGVAAAGAGAAAAARRVRAGEQPEVGASGTPSTSSSSTRRTTSRRRARRRSRAGAATPSTPSARWRCASWPTSASTGCSCPRRRTTATRSRSRRCWR